MRVWWKLGTGTRHKNTVRGIVSACRRLCFMRLVRALVYFVVVVPTAPMAHANDYGTAWHCFYLSFGDTPYGTAGSWGYPPTRPDQTLEQAIRENGVFKTSKEVLDAHLGGLVEWQHSGNEFGTGEIFYNYNPQFSSDENPYEAGVWLGNGADGHAANGWNPAARISTRRITGPSMYLSQEFNLWLAQQCGQVFTVKLTNDDPTPAGNLAEVLPHGSAPRLRASVYDESGQKVPNAQVELMVEAVENSGGHQHHAGRPNGTLRSFSGVSGKPSSGETVYGQTLNIADERFGSFSFSFKAPAPAGDHKIKAKCIGKYVCTQGGLDTVWVGYRDLIPIPPSETYWSFIGNPLHHPDRFNLEGVAFSRLFQIAERYRTKYPDAPLIGLNDASLPRGGLFDYKDTWTRPHKCHSRGYGIDVRANTDTGATIPKKYRKTFEKIAWDHGVDPRMEDRGSGNQHYHLYLILPTDRGCEP